MSSIKLGSITADYSTRKKTYTITGTNIDRVFDHIVKPLVGSTGRYMFRTIKQGILEVYEFFLFELHWCLNRALDNHPDMVFKAGSSIVNDLEKFIRTKTWIAERYSKLDPNILDLKRIKSKMVFEPLEHQIKAFQKYEEIKKLTNLRGFELDMAVGAGKTYTSLALAEALDYDYVIILAPKATIEQVWIKSIKELYKIKQTYIYLPENNKFNYERFTILHYEYLFKLANNKELLRKFKRLKPMLIIDEYHNFNEIKSKRTQELINIVEYIDFNDIALLTGTPIKMNVTELIPLLYILDRKFPPVIDRFKSFYTSLNENRRELLLERFGIYKERIETNKDMLPEIKIEEYKIKIPDAKKYTLKQINEDIERYKIERQKELYAKLPKYKAEFDEILNEAYNNMIKNGWGKTKANELIKRYKKLCKEIYKASESGTLQSVKSLIEEARKIEKTLETYLSPSSIKKFRDIRSIIKYPKLKILGEALGKILLRRRIECYIDLAKNLNYKTLLSLTHKKGIIFSKFISVCEEAYKKCVKEGYEPGKVYGPYIKNLNEVVNRFNNLKDPLNPIIASYQALSTGVPLTAGNVIICIDLTYRVYMLEQAIARAWRLGNEDTVIVLLVKLDTGNEFNITDRDLFIINLSEHNVELISGNKLPYELPRQKLQSEVEEDLPEDIEEEIEEEVNESLEKIANIEMKEFVDNYEVESPMELVKNFINNVMFKL